MAGGEGEPPAAVGGIGAGVGREHRLADGQAVGTPRRDRVGAGVVPGQGVAAAGVRPRRPGGDREGAHGVGSADQPVVDAAEVDVQVVDHRAPHHARGRVDHGPGEVRPGPPAGAWPLGVVEDDGVARDRVVDVVGVGGVPHPERVVVAPAHRAAVARDQRDAGAVLGLPVQQRAACRRRVPVEEQRGDHQHDVAAGDRHVVDHRGALDAVDGVIGRAVPSRPIVVQARNGGVRR